ncbi:hypothetical protein [Alicyclobacillus herbarius]|uniref:hypothetical protein n=1 Tax=Alicyclobacillus herbarius TaxID=122960 RepID=UPI0012DEB84E|nr:hypothetical protein [Alicyclobacillus herbarius]
MPKPSIKYAVISLLCQEPEGLWEHEIYERLRGHYAKANLCCIREELTSFSTVGWIETAAIAEYKGELIRKFKLVDSHRAFIHYQLDASNLLANLTVNSMPS